MKKLTVTMALIATIMIGCGGGSGGSSGGGEQTNQSVNTGFKYPGVFDRDELFFISAHREALGILLGGYFEADKLLLIHEINQIVGMVDLSVHARLNMIEDLDGVSRASCGQGGLAAISYSSTDDTPVYGEFQMTHFGGVGMKLADDSTDCPSQYFDGYIKYTISDTPESITVKYGDISIDPNPFFYSNTYIHDAVEGLLGGGTITFPNYPNKDSLIFKTKPGQSLERTIIEGGKITDSITISEADISDIDDGEKTTINASYIREWLENGETFILSTNISNLVYNKDTYIISGTVEFRLNVKGKPSKYVNASVSYGSGVRVTFNKEGVETHRNY